MAVPFLGLFSTASQAFGGPAARADPYMGYNFVVEIGGLLGGGFTQVSGLESSVELESYREGGVNDYLHQLPGSVSYPNLVLSRGLTVVDVLWDWYWLTAQGRPMLLNGTIMLLNNQRLPVMWWNFRHAYPVKWVGPSLDASSDGQAAIEQLELVHRGLVQSLPSQAFGAVRGATGLAALGGASGPRQLL
jgi:phage tail-like protein